MFGRKKQTEPEQGRAVRQVDRGSAQGPAFSYYNNRPTEVARDRRFDRRVVESTERSGYSLDSGRSRGVSRSWLSKVPFWLMLLVFGVCFIKVLLLSTRPKVIVVGKSAEAANYLKSSEVYEAAGHKALSGSMLNYSKLTADLNGTAKSLERQFPELQAVSLSVPLVGSRPILYLQVAQPSLILQNDDGNYALNSSGVALAKLQSLPAHIPTAVNQSSARPSLGKHYLPASTVTFVQSVAYQFAAAHQDINTFVLPARAPYELDVRLSGQQYFIKMSLEEDAKVQSGAAIGTIEQLGSAVPSEYLDVRTPGRVYYK